MIGTKKIKKGQIESYTTADVADSVGKRYQTENQNTFNDATSSIQTQLGTKQTYLVKDSVPTSAITGTTSQSQIGASILIPANTFSASDVMILDSFGVSKTGTAGTCFFRLLQNTSDTLAGSNTLATALLTGTQITGNMQRIFEINGGLFKNRIGGSVSAFTDKQGSGTTGLSVSFDPTIDNYFFRTVSLANAADSVISTQLVILK